MSWEIFQVAPLTRVCYKTGKFEWGTGLWGKISHHQCQHLLPTVLCLQEMVGEGGTPEHYQHGFEARILISSHVSYFPCHHWQRHRACKILLSLTHSSPRFGWERWLWRGPSTPPVSWECWGCSQTLLLEMEYLNRQYQHPCVFVYVSSINVFTPKKDRREGKECWCPIGFNIWVINNFVAYPYPTAGWSALDNHR